MNNLVHGPLCVPLTFGRHRVTILIPCEQTMRSTSIEILIKSSMTQQSNQTAQIKNYYLFIVWDKIIWNISDFKLHFLFVLMFVVGKTCLYYRAHDYV